MSSSRLLPVYFRSLLFSGCKGDCTIPSIGFSLSSDSHDTSGQPGQYEDYNAFDQVPFFSSLFCVWKRADIDSRARISTRFGTLLAQPRLIISK